MYDLDGWQVLRGQELVKIFQPIAVYNAYTSEVCEGKECAGIAAIGTAACTLTR